LTRIVFNPSREKRGGPIWPR